MKNRFKYIDKFGVELEGGWKSGFKVDGKSAIWHHDASVGCRGPKTGEVVSKPMDNLETLDSFIRKWYPTYKDESCGFHIHISTKKPIYYTYLTSSKFYRDFYKFIREFANNYKVFKDNGFDDRIYGQNEMCDKRFIPDLQMKMKYKYDDNEVENTRFCGLNYCYGIHGTLENRIFPMFSHKSVASSAAREYILFVEDWLSKNEKSLIKSLLNPKKPISLNKI